MSTVAQPQSLNVIAFKKAVIDAHVKELEDLKSVELLSVRKESPPNSDVIEVLPFGALKALTDAKQRESDDNGIAVEAVNSKNQIASKLATNVSQSQSSTSTASHFVMLPYLKAAAIRSNRQLDRFKVFENGRIGIVLGNRLRLVYSEVWKHVNNSKHVPIQLYGPAGLGKSFILFGIACTLLQDNMLFKAGQLEGKEVHVAYIRDAGIFSSENNFFIKFVEALCVAYYDRDDILEILFPFINLPFKVDNFNAALRYAELGNLVVILDQLNSIPNDVVRLWDDMCTFLLGLPHVCVVTLASANNCGSEYIMTSFPIYLRFTENEALGLLSIYGMELSREDIEFESKMAAIKHATGFIPLELRLFAEINIQDEINIEDDFWHKLDAFVKRRTQIMSDNHENYFVQLTPNSLTNYEESLLAMASGAEITGSVFDRQLLVQSNSTNEMSQMVPSLGRYLLPISGVARQVLISRIDFQSTPTSKFLQGLLQNSSNMSLVGQTVKFYITQMMNVRSTINWPIVKVSHPAKVVETVTMRDYDVRYFYGNGTPGRQIQFSKTKNCLFIPRNANYPYVDIIYYSHGSSTKLYVFRICVARDASKHAHTNADFEISGLLHAWISYLGLQQEEEKQNGLKRQRMKRSTGPVFDTTSSYKYIWVVGSEAIGLDENSLKSSIESLAKNNAAVLEILLSFKVAQDSQ